jgi:hypothetical protein
MKISPAPFRGLLFCGRSSRRQAKTLHGRFIAQDIYGAWWDRNVVADGRAAFDVSVKLYFRAIAGCGD